MSTGATPMRLWRFTLRLRKRPYSQASWLAKRFRVPLKLVPNCWRQRGPFTDQRSSSAKRFHTLCEKTSLPQRGKVISILIENGLYWTKLLQSKLLPRLKAIRWKEHSPVRENEVGGRTLRAAKRSGYGSTHH